MKIPWRYFAFDTITVCALIIGLLPPLIANYIVFTSELHYVPKILVGFFLVTGFPGIFLNNLCEHNLHLNGLFFWLGQFAAYYLVGKIIFISKRKGETENKTKKKKVLIISFVTAAIIVFSACCYFLPFYIQYRFDSPCKCTLKNPANDINAVFLRHGFLIGSRISFFLESGKMFLKLGTVESDDALIFNEACWSEDGTVIASKSRIIGYNEAPETDGPFIFTHAYDLKEMKAYVPEKDISDKSPQAWVKRAEKIEKLLSERGGEGSKITKDNLEMLKISWWNWRKYRDYGK